jgi:hypothetical protein
LVDDDAGLRAGGVGDCKRGVFGETGPEKPDVTAPRPRDDSRSVEREHTRIGALDFDYERSLIGTRASGRRLVAAIRFAPCVLEGARYNLPL